MAKNYVFAEDILAHLSGEDSKEMLEYMDQVVLKESRYIFTTRKSGRQYGYCTYCHTKWETDSIRHNDTEICPCCKSECTVKASGYGRKAMVDEAYFVWYEKSVINPEAIIARGIYALRNYRGDYHNVKTQYKDVILYVFEPGGAVSISRNAWHSRGDSKMYVGEDWLKCDSIYSMTSKDHFQHIPDFCSLESIKKAVKDTPFQYSCWEEYQNHYACHDMVKFFGLYSKWPCIEYLTKLGFKNLVTSKLEGYRTYRAINWRGNSLLDVLKINKDDLKEIQEYDGTISFLDLKIFQLAKEDNTNLSIDEACELANKFTYTTYDYLFEMLEYGKMSKILNYINKQIEKYEDQFRDESYVLTTWKDYISDCIELEMDLEDDRVLYPKNLYNAHQNTIKQVEIKASKELDEQIKARIKKLDKYRFKSDELLIRPAANSEELIAEGKALNHCVGTYADKYAAGKTIILLIRKVSKPDEPYFTVEIKYNEVHQARGKDNRGTNEEVSQFLKKFKNQILLGMKQKQQIPA